MINILESGIVEYLGEKDGQRWRTTLQPGETARAAQILSAEELAEVTSAWTPAVVQKWRNEHPEAPPRPPRPTSLQDRLALLEADVLEGTPATRLALARAAYKDGRLTDARLDNLVARGRLTQAQADAIRQP